MEWWCPKCKYVENGTIHPSGQEVVRHRCYEDYHVCDNRQPLLEEEDTVPLPVDEVENEIFLVFDGHRFVPQFRIWNDLTTCQCDLDEYASYEVVEIDEEDFDGFEVLGVLEKNAADTYK